jgi:hypothetical protein
VCTVLDLKTFVTALGTEKNLALFEVAGVGEGDGLEFENYAVLGVGVDGGVKNLKFELVVELAPGL